MMRGSARLGYVRISICGGMADVGRVLVMTLLDGTSLVVKAALDAAPVTDYVQSNVAVADVKKFLDKGFVLVDIRAPDELLETGYKSSWKHIAVRPLTHSFHFFSPSYPNAKSVERNIGNV